MPGKRFLFIRHGETDWNAEGRLQGQRDIPLNPRGRDQASEAGRRTLRHLAAQAVAADALCFVASPLGRARDTMERVRLAMGLVPGDYETDDRLKEFSFGDWEGHTWGELKRLDPDQVRRRRRDKWSFVPPGGESYAMLCERLRPWLDHVPDGAVVVSHGGVARALMVLLGGLSPEAAPDTEIRQGRVIRFEPHKYAWI